MQEISIIIKNWNLAYFQFYFDFFKCSESLFFKCRKRKVECKEKISGSFSVFTQLLNTSYQFRTTSVIVIIWSKCFGICLVAMNIGTI